MFRTIFAHELRLLVRDRSALIAGGVLLLATLAALLAGSADVARRDALLAQAKVEEQRTFTEFREAVRPTEGLETGSTGFDASTNPAILSMFYPRPAVLPPAPLAVLSVGQSDVYPSLYRVTGERKDSFLDAVELTNPLHALTGPFDLAFVVVFLLPLFLLALGHDLLAREREGGTLAQVLAQPVRLRSLVGAKLLARSVLLLVIIVAAAGALLLTGHLTSATTWALFGLWSLLVLAYGAVWLGLAALVDAWGRSAAANIVAVSGAWLLLALIGPALLHLGVSQARPTPPRAELLIATRDVETSSRRPVDLLNAYYREHPDRYPTHPTFDVDVYDFPLYWAAIQREVDRQLEPIVMRYDDALADQERLAWIARLTMPAPLALEALNDIAGSGLHRYQRFTEQVMRFHEEHRAFYEPLIFSKTSLTRDDYDRMPSFEFVEESVMDATGRVLPALFGLGALAMLALIGAALGYRSTATRSG